MKFRILQLLGLLVLFVIAMAIYQRLGNHDSFRTSPAHPSQQSQPSNSLYDLKPR